MIVAAKPVANSEAEQLGLACTRCGCHDLRVVRTCQRLRSISRTRQCRHCGKRIVSTERIIGYAADFFDSTPPV